VAYRATLKDPALLAEIERAQIQFQPAPAEVVKTIVTRTAATSGAIVARAKDVLQAP
jgi:hypothetical protein